jgi:hypothetical protein
MLLQPPLHANTSSSEKSLLPSLFLVLQRRVLTLCALELDLRRLHWRLLLLLLAGSAAVQPRHLFPLLSASPTGAVSGSLSRSRSLPLPHPPLPISIISLLPFHQSRSQFQSQLQSQSHQCQSNVPTPTSPPLSPSPPQRSPSASIIAAIYHRGRLKNNLSEMVPSLLSLLRPSPRLRLRLRLQLPLQTHYY